jgi:ribonuclease P protein subunit RPR2
VPRRRKGLERKIARERVAILFSLAEEEAVKGNLARADRYAQLARRIGMRYNVSLPTPYRRFYCRSCGSYLAPGSTAAFRVRRSRVIVTCKICGRIYRFPYLREVKERRRSSRR